MAESPVTAILTGAAACASSFPQLVSHQCQLAKLATDAWHTRLPTESKLLLHHGVRDLRAAVKALQTAYLQLHDAWEVAATRLGDLVDFGTLSRQLLASLAAALRAELTAAVDCEAATREVLARLVQLQSSESPSPLLSLSGHLSASVDQLTDFCYQLSAWADQVSRLEVPLAGAVRLPRDAAAQLRQLLTCWSGRGSGAAMTIEEEAAEAEIDVLSARMLGVVAAQTVVSSG